MPFRLLQQRQPSAVPITEPAPVAGKILTVLAPLWRDDTLGKALFQLRKQQVAALPVAEAGQVVGWISEQHVADLLIENPAAERTSVGEVIEPVPALLGVGEPLENVLAIFQATGVSLLPVVWSDGRYQGCVTRMDALLASAGRQPAPPRIGGMATPLGVYLTTGTVHGGVGDLGLMLTGVVMSFILWVAQTLVILFSALGCFFTGKAFYHHLFIMLTQDSYSGPPLEEMWLLLVSSGLLMVVFLALLRFAPWLPGYHAAEHQTVNAIEAGEPLTPEAVKRMPRAHPRCGTNILSFVKLSYLGVALVSLVLSTRMGRQHLDAVITLFLLSALLVVISWRRYGALLQNYVTTRPASPKEIASGIRAGEEVLYAHLHSPYIPPRSAQRIWRIGLLQVMIGITLAGFVLQLLDARLDYLWHLLVK